jgi:signal peptide peptidase SppA
MPATPHSNTATVDKPWDGSAAVANLSNGAGQATYEKVFAWRDPQGDADKKASYKLPHHEVGQDGTPGAANVNAVRNVLSRLSQTDGPTDTDRSTIRSNMLSHLKKNSTKSELLDDEEALALSLILGAAPVIGFAAGRCWAMEENALCTLIGRIEAGGMQISDAVMASAVSAARGRSVQTTGNGVAVIPLKGVITPQPSLMSMIFGGGDGSLSSLRANLREAQANPDVKSIVLDVNSPGGQVDGVPEMAKEVAEMRDTGGKPMVAVSNHTMASAAYWLGSQCHEVVASPSSEIGSVGVYQRHADMSEAAKKEGVAMTFISAGKFKTEGHPFAPLDPEAAAHLQEGVNDFYGMFTKGVAEGRQTELDPAQVADGVAFGAGRTFVGKRAVKADLADREATLSETVNRLSSGRGRVKRMAAEFDPEAAPSGELTGFAGYSPEDRARVMDVLAQVR